MFSEHKAASSFSQVFPNFLPSFKSWEKLGGFYPKLGKKLGIPDNSEIPSKALK